MTRRFAFDIDVTGACNLRCPCCPQGNTTEYRLARGFMEPELLAGIVRKAASECMVTGINLFNWADPVLHPRLPELITIVQTAGIPCHISSNLNLLPGADALMTANPASFKISLSGFTQDIYGFFHRSGNIETVKRHMVELAEAKKRTGSTTRIFVSYHRYKNNLKDEPLLRDFAVKLGFEFEPAWALMFPLEKILACAGEEIGGSPLTREDHQLIDRLALPLAEALAAAETCHNQPCSLRESQISIDFRGNVMLCCGIYNADKYCIGNYLEMSLDEIRHIRQSHPMCTICMQHGGHAYLTYRTPGMDELLLAVIDPEDAELLHLRDEITQKRLQIRLDAIYRRYFSQWMSNRQKILLKTLVRHILRTVTRRGRIAHD